MAANRGGRQFRDRQFDDKTRSHRKIVLDVDAAAVLRDNARRNGQPKARAAILG